MSKRLLLAALSLILAVGGPALTGLAQDNPPSALLNAALADLSARAGETITLDDLSLWRWSQSNYPDTSLGCPQAGQSYAQVLTNGYQFVFTLNGATFDYRASADGRTLFLCSGPAVVPAAPAVQATTAPIVQPAPATALATVSEGRAVCSGAMNTRLDVGAIGRVRAAGLPVNLRRTPGSASTRDGQIEPGDEFTVFGGPQCAENLVWWQVDVDGLRGWIGEGANGVYWVEPTGAVLIPATPAVAGTPASAPPVSAISEEAQIFVTTTTALPPLDAASAARLTRFVDLPVNTVVTGLVWSPDGGTLGITTYAGLRLYSTLGYRLPPRLFDVPNGPTLDVAFSPDGGLLATAHTDASVRLWDLATGGLRAVLRGGTAPVHTVAFSPDGTLIASAGGDDAGADSAIRLWSVDTRSQVAALEGHSGAVLDVAFSPDGTLLASGGADNTVRLWDVASGSPGTLLPDHGGPVHAVTFSPDGAWLASAGEDSLIHLWEIGPGEQRLLEQGAPVLELVFSPDGVLLVAAGGPMDSAVRVWDPASASLVAAVEAGSTAAEASVTGLAFNPDGSLLALTLSESSSGVLRVLGVAP